MSTNSRSAQFEDSHWNPSNGRMPRWKGRRLKRNIQSPTGQDTSQARQNFITKLRLPFSPISPSGYFFWKLSFICLRQFDRLNFPSGKAFIGQTFWQKTLHVSQGAKSLNASVGSKSPSSRIERSLILGGRF